MQLDCLKADGWQRPFGYRTSNVETAGLIELGRGRSRIIERKAMVKQAR